MAPYLGHFSLTSDALLTVLTLSALPNSNVTVATSQWTDLHCIHTGDTDTAEACVCVDLLLSCCFFLLFVFLEFKEIEQEGEGQTH